MRKIVVYGAALLALVSCGKSDKFSVTGKVESAKGDTLFLEQVGMNEVKVLDSVILSSDGVFKFKQKAPEFSPEFYRLRLKDQLINLSVDSIEEIDIKANAGKFATSYLVQGSENCAQIQKMNIGAIQTKLKIDSLLKLNQAKLISIEKFDSTVQNILKKYKAEASRYIFGNPKSGAAYFALFQKIHGYLIFDPYKKEDLRAFAAVATSYDVYHPNNPRSKHLKEFTLQAMKATRAPKPIQIKEEQVSVKGNFEVTLPDKKGSTQKLSSQIGKVVLLSFTAYQTKFSPEVNLELRSIYTSCKAKRFEIYQVSLDPDENYWKVSAANLPWICVRDADGQYSQYARTYNVSELPTFFILNKQGEVVKRVDNLKTLKAEVEKML
ncbi:MAG: thioredoxin-like domain-containing protein [Bacteroidota bacterium]|nr:thioredoxin-like domain-containing protein [Bacteroidota bacterium]